MLIASLSPLAACSGSGSAELPPPSLTIPCAAPSALPDGPMSQAQVELAWGTDRSNLRSCAARQNALADWAGEVAATILP